ncbi:hypothetical protein AYI69_g2334 [Smittium culicis]|uniref:Uncharacterized protein n=1 Tax=Smittium culicis TaxID=133412 RepID=A0A1R1YMQ3_9FUNG|nr:hypothetical protein AYI69_g2334 [Smittium culicis]
MKSATFLLLGLCVQAVTIPGGNRDRFESLNRAERDYSIGIKPVPLNESKLKSADYSNDESSSEDVSGVEIDDDKSSETIDDSDKDRNDNVVKEVEYNDDTDDEVVVYKDDGDVRDEGAEKYVYKRRDYDSEGEEDDDDDEIFGDEDDEIFGGSEYDTDDIADEIFGDEVDKDDGNVRDEGAEKYVYKRRDDGSEGEEEDDDDDDEIFGDDEDEVFGDDDDEIFGGGEYDTDDIAYEIFGDEVDKDDDEISSDEKGQGLGSENTVEEYGCKVNPDGSETCYSGSDSILLKGERNGEGPVKEFQPAGSDAVFGDKTSGNGQGGSNSYAADTSTNQKRDVLNGVNHNRNYHISLEKYMQNSLKLENSVKSVMHYFIERYRILHGIFINYGKMYPGNMSVHFEGSENRSGLCESDDSNGKDINTIQCSRETFVNSRTTTATRTFHRSKGLNDNGVEFYEIKKQLDYLYEKVKYHSPIYTFYLSVLDIDELIEARRKFNSDLFDLTKKFEEFRREYEVIIYSYNINMRDYEKRRYLDPLEKTAAQVEYVKRAQTQFKLAYGGVIDMYSKYYSSNKNEKYAGVS